MADGRVVTEGFHRRVYAVVRTIPPGRVATYGDVAAALGSPRVARHVGWALAALGGADADDVPWHRVLNARGEVSERSARSPDGVGAPSPQRLLLEAEGVAFDARGRVDLRAYRHRFAVEP